MKRESKGQRVKTFKAWIPNSDLTKVETQVVVYFNASNGEFSIHQGSHMFATAREHMTSRLTRDRELRIHDHMITAYVLETIVQGFADICHAYTNAMREALKKKVIRFTFKRNAPWYQDGIPAASDISFCGTPAIHFTYEVLHRIGDALYEKRDDESNLQYRGSATEARFREGDAITIDWTEEREAFFENMQSSLLALIHRVDDFQKNLLVNVDKAIAASGPLLLPKPESIS